MTRTHKSTDRDHSGTCPDSKGVPRHFGKSRYVGNNPGDTKKHGGGKGNWGRQGMSELEDCEYNMNKTRRRSNSSSHASMMAALSTKFEAVDPEAIVEYEESIHGPLAEDLDSPADTHHLEKVETSDSAITTESVDTKKK
ncbi:hypothetical protein K470DRAFT_49651 [Piedraia hortae CBS 480.64]|uniref:Hyaluronan/mRNA-binding protein domain-containing protein n=1 Tax=Piedraia hortae CBS 480.64 TaxID=1314780 RepID=A0A6A7C988_9PEZI|nr:hypothetical protein K470DRAFT_49651 [Piedraia hortae CBS 480.64]